MRKMFEKEEKIMDIAKINFDSIFDAIIKAEKKFGFVFENGIGPLQLTKDCLNVVSMFYEKQYEEENLLDLDRAKFIAKLYLKIVAKNYSEKSKKPITYELLVKLFRYDEKSLYKKPAEKYWEAVMLYLK